MSSNDEKSRLPRIFLFFLLALLGAFAALLSSSRRPRFERRWEDLEEMDEDLTDHEPPVGERPAPTVPSVSLEVDGPVGDLFVDDGGGAGPAVVFLHGLGGSSRQWQPQLARLRPRRRALALDLRGHGDSAPADDPDAYTLEGYRRDLETVLETLDLERVILVGHSLGATVALAHASRRPEQVAGLMLVDPAGDQSRLPEDQLEIILEALEDDPAGEMEWTYKQLLVGSEPEVADQVLADLRLTDPRAFRPSLASSFATSPVPWLRAYTGPALSVVSDLNALPSSLHNLVEDLPWKLIPEVSHWLMMDRPEEVAEALDHLLVSVEEATPVGSP